MTDFLNLSNGVPRSKLAESSASGVSDVDTLFTQTFDSATLANFTHTGLELDTTAPLHGTTSAKLTHDASVNQSFKEVIAVDSKFRGQNVTVAFNIASTASEGNITFSVYDETNAADIVASEQITFDSDITRQTISFAIPATCSSLSYTFIALPEVGSPTTYIDDIVAKISSTVSLTQSAFVEEEDLYVRAEGNSGTAVTANVTDIPFTLAFDNTGGWDGNSFTVPEDGVYTISGSVYFTTTMSNRTELYVDGVYYQVLGPFISHTVHSINLTERFTAGQVLSIRTEVGGTLNSANAGAHYLNIVKKKGIKQVNVNVDQKITIPTSELRFEDATSKGSTATFVVKFNNLAKMRGGAFEVVDTAEDGTYVRMKRAGKIEVSATVYSSTASTSYYISKNQATLTAAPSTSETLARKYVATVNEVANLSAITFVEVGDIIRVCANNTLSSTPGTGLTITHQEQDIQVSVSNTLPQFSESDFVFKGAGNSGEVITNAVTDIPFGTVEDLQGRWSGNSFSVPEDGLYSISGAVYFDSTGDRAIELYVDGSTYRRVSNRGTTNVFNFSITEKFTAGQSLSFRTAANGGTLESIADFRHHFLTITKVGKPNVTGVNITPFVNIPYLKKQYSKLRSDVAVIATTDLSTLVTESTGSGLFRLNSDGITILENCKINLSISAGHVATTSSAYIMRNGAYIALDLGRYSTATSNYANTSVELEASVGDVFMFISNGDGANPSGVNMFITAEATSNTIVTPTDSFSTDTASLQYASSSEYNLTTLANAPVGTFITFTQTAGGNTRVQTTVAPTQTVEDMNINGIHIYQRNFDANSTAQQPSCIAIQIGKGLKGVTKTVYANAGKGADGITASLDYAANASGTSDFGVRYKEYNETTGILMFDAGTHSSSSTTSVFMLSDTGTQADGYLVISGSKSPPLTGVPELMPRIAILTDVKPSGTAGGSAISGTQTRTLNTLDDPFGIVTSLVSNEFTLPAGTYYLEGSAPAYAVNRHQLSIYNVTDATTAIVGMPAYSPAADEQRSSVSGYIKISSPKTFSVRHWTTTAGGGNTLGVEAGSGIGEVYTYIKIMKVK